MTIRIKLSDLEEKTIQILNDSDSVIYEIYVPLKEYTTIAAPISIGTQTVCKYKNDVLDQNLSIQPSCSNRFIVGRQVRVKK